MISCNHADCHLSGKSRCCSSVLFLAILMGYVTHSAAMLVLDRKYAAVMFWKVRLHAFAAAVADPQICCCRSDQAAQATPRERQRVLRSSQKDEHGAPDLPKHEGLLSSGAQGDESDEGPVEMLGKRKRIKVDYTRLNAEMFGDVESYEGEATEDEDFSPRAAARAGGES